MLEARGRFGRVWVAHLVHPRRSPAGIRARRSREPPGPREGRDSGDRAISSQGILPYGPPLAYSGGMRLGTLVAVVAAVLSSACASRVATSSVHFENLTP